MKFLLPLFALLAFHFIANCNGGGFDGGFHQGRAFPVAFAPKAKKNTSTKTTKASSTSGRFSAAFRSKIRADRCKWTPNRSDATSGTGAGIGIGTREGTGVMWTEPESEHKTEFGASAFGSSAGMGSETKREDKNNNDSPSNGDHGSGIIKNDAQVHILPELGPSPSRKGGNFGTAGAEGNSTGSMSGTTKLGHRREMNGAAGALLERAMERNRRAQQKLELVAKPSRNADGNASSDTGSHKGKSATAAETPAKKSRFRVFLSSKSNADNSDKKNPYGQAGDYTAEQVAQWVENDKEAKGKNDMYLAHLEQTYEETKKKQNATSSPLGTIFEGEREGREDDDDGSHEEEAAAAKASPIQSDTSAESAEIARSTSSGTSDGDVGVDIVSPPAIEDDDDVGPIPSSLKPPASLKDSAAAPVFYQDEISAAGVEGGNSKNLDNSSRAVSFVDEDGASFDF